MVGAFVPMGNNFNHLQLGMVRTYNLTSIDPNYKALLQRKAHSDFDEQKYCFLFHGKPHADEAKLWAKHFASLGQQETIVEMP
jgi:hypothetical protein